MDWKKGVRELVDEYRGIDASRWAQRLALSRVIAEEICIVLIQRNAPGAQVGRKDRENLDGLIQRVGAPAIVKRHLKTIQEHSNPSHHAGAARREIDGLSARAGLSALDYVLAWFEATDLSAPLGSETDGFAVEPSLAADARSFGLVVDDDRLVSFVAQGKELLVFDAAGRCSGSVALPFAPRHTILSARGDHAVLADDAAIVIVWLTHCRPRTGPLIRATDTTGVYASNRHGDFILVLRSTSKGADRLRLSVRSGLATVEHPRLLPPGPWVGATAWGAGSPIVITAAEELQGPLEVTTLLDGCGGSRRIALDSAHMADGPAVALITASSERRNMHLLAKGGSGWRMHSSITVPTDVDHIYLCRTDGEHLGPVFVRSAGRLRGWTAAELMA